MKITKTPDDIKRAQTKRDEEYAAFQNRKRIANQGCENCPICGETKGQYISSCIGEGVGLKGIEELPPIFFDKGFFITKTMAKDCYKCWTCGTEWESEPYKW